MTSAPETVMFFAAGFGTRMGDLTRDMPKPMIRVASRTLMDHALDLTRATEIRSRVVNIHYKADMFADFLADRNVTISLELPDILDTGGGLKAALPLIGENPVYTMNTDAIWSGPNPLHVLADQWNPDVMDALLICVPLGAAVGRKGAGDFNLSAKDQIHRGGDYVYGGVQIIKTDLVRTHEGRVFSLNAIWDEIAARGRLFGARYPGKWCDVGHPEGIKLAEKLLLEPDV